MRKGTDYIIENLCLEKMARIVICSDNGSNLLHGSKIKEFLDNPNNQVGGMSIDAGLGVVHIKWDGEYWVPHA